MARYRNIPVEVDAIQFHGTPESAIEVFEMFDIPGGKFLPDLDLRYGELLIPTLEDGKDNQAKHIASRGDFIIRGVEGEFYPCKPRIFAKTYEAVD